MQEGAQGRGAHQVAACNHIGQDRLGGKAQHHATAQTGCGQGHEVDAQQAQADAEAALHSPHAQVADVAEGIHAVSPYYAELEVHDSGI